MLWGRWLKTLIPVVYGPFVTLDNLTFLGYKLIFILVFLKKTEVKLAYDVGGMIILEWIVRD
jgi:hypothetical protein